MPSDAVPSETPAETPREKRLHPLTLVFSTGAVARQMVFPAIVGGLSAGQGDVGRIVSVGVAVLALPALLAAVAKFWFFRYRLAGADLVLRSGLLSRKHRVIPLARVQNVEVRQGALQRLFRVAELRVETAGGSGQAEAVLSVLAAAEARGLRAEVAARRRAALPAAPSSETAPGAPEDGAAPSEIPTRSYAPPLVKLRTTDVLLAGATANEGGVIAAALAGGLQLADDLRLPWLERLGEPFGWLERAVGPGSAPLLALAVALGVVFLFVGWLFSIAGAVVRYHGYTLAREGGELRKRYGLLSVREGSVPLERVQALRVEESLLRRAVGLVTVKIETAGGAPGEGGGRGGAEAFVPIAHRGDLPRLVRGIFDDLDFDRISLRPVDPRSRRRAVRRYAVLVGTPALVFAAMALRAGEPGWLLALLPVLPLPWLLARWEYAHRGYALERGYVVARAGVLNRVTWIIPDVRLQTAHVTETPFQRRHGLASLVVDTAAGGKQAVVIDLGTARARALLEEVVARLHAARRARAPRRGVA